MLRCRRSQQDTNRTCQCLSPRGGEVSRMVAVFRCRKPILRKSSIYPVVSQLSDLNQSKFQRNRQWEAVEFGCGMWHNVANVWNKVLIQANSGLPAKFRGLLTYVRSDYALGTPPPTPWCKHVYMQTLTRVDWDLTQNKQRRTSAKDACRLKQFDLSTPRCDDGLGQTQHNSRCMNVSVDG